MNEEEKKIKNSQIRDDYDIKLEKITNLSEAVELHQNVKQSVDNNEIEINYLKYIENYLQEKFFNGVVFEEMQANALFDVISPELLKVENFNSAKLDIAVIGHHFEEQDNYIDLICTYDNQFICLFGVMEKNKQKTLKYEPRKFSRTDMIEAVSSKIEKDKKVQMEQYDEYYVTTDELGIKVFSERKIVSILKIEETKFDKIKNKLISIFNKKIFIKKKPMANMELVYDSNPNRFKNIKSTNKNIVKNRMKALLTNERRITRNVNN